ncbi:hypothetical protein E2C01_018060 [Portunus trituberculatus]|uniref:Uncharacterized protein n=1 Tax=Portunus trituberculatus TaxID=210409 RepID=A0A5B7DVG9_PORTR|nr:hypothetical protein [Portunus trituberculatus]
MGMGVPGVATLLDPPGQVTGRAGAAGWLPPLRHEPASGTARRGNMLSLSVVEASLCPDPPELLVLADVIVDEEVVEPRESRHGSPGKPFARKSLVMSAVKGEGWVKPCLASGGPSEDSKLASSTVGEGGIICSCRRGSGRRRPEPVWILVALRGSPSRRRTSRCILRERYR